MPVDERSSERGKDFDLVRIGRYFSEFSPQAMVTIEGSGYIIRDVNAAFLKLVGRDSADMIGRGFGEIVTGTATNECLALLGRVYHTGLPDILIEQLHNKSIPIYWSYSVWAIPGPDNRPLGLVVQVTDATEIALFRRQLVEMNEQLLLSVTRQHELTEIEERANQLKDDFLATLSHELRTPLSVIIGWTELLRTTKISPETTLHAAEVILRNARIQLKMIEDLLDISRIVAGKLHLNLQRISLADIVSSAVDSQRPAAKAKQIEFELRLGESEVQILGDADRLQQVAWNLLANAIKFTPPGGRIVIETTHTQTQALLTISDNGPGIAAAFLPHLFERFRQADSSSTRNFGGLGIGLSIVRQLVELHGGEVYAQSEGEGCGSTFTVSLPLAATGNSGSGLADTQNASQDWTSRLAGVRVLVVDDDPDLCELLGVILKSSGAQVTTVNTATAALSALAEGHFDVLSSDINMPHEDGYSLISKVRELDNQRGNTILAIAMTAHSGDAHRERMLTSGFQVYLEKPIGPETFVDAVADLMERI